MCCAPNDQNCDCLDLYLSIIGNCVFFCKGLDMLSRTNSAKLSDAIEKARDQTVAIVKMAQNILDSKQVF